MNRIALMLASVAAAGLLAGCDRIATIAAGGPADKSAVVATVDGEKITEAQLDIELANAQAANPKDPEVRRAVLQRLVVRKLLANAAQEQKLDEQPQAMILRQAAAETFDAGLIQRDIVSKTPAPTRPEVERYIQERPTMFAQRTLYLVDELRLAGRPDAALAQAIQPATTLEQVEAVLKARGVAYQRAVGQLDSVRMPPGVARQVAALPQGAPFVLPAGGGVVVGRVRATKPQPITGEAAISVATQALTAERRNKAVNDRIQALMAEKKDKIVYEEGYAPPAKAGG